MPLRESNRNIMITTGREQNKDRSHKIGARRSSVAKASIQDAQSCNAFQGTESILLQQLDHGLSCLIPSDVCAEVEESLVQVCQGSCSEQTR